MSSLRPALLPLLLLTAACSTGPRTAADSVFLGRFVTLDPARPVAEALAVLNGRIIAVGSERDVDRQVPDDVPRTRLNGVAVPGLADPHVHALALGEQLEMLDLRGLQKEEIVRRVAERARNAPLGSWIEGRGWDQGFWRPAEFPVADDLDGVSPNHPVVLTRIDGHSVWVNSAALRAAGIDAATPDPAGGRLLRHGDGTPTGMLVDDAVDLVRTHMPPVTRARKRQRLEAALAQYARWGLTSVHDAGVDLDGISLYRELLAEHRLPLRVYVMAQGTGPTAEALLARAPEPPAGDGRLFVRSFKIMLDGALGSRGAQLFEPYSDAPGESGLELMSDDELASVVQRAAARGYQVNAHAIGDRAVRRALDAFERYGGPGLAGRRFRIEHASMVHEADLPRFARLGVIASLQPGFVGEYSRWAIDRVGPERIRRVLRTAELIRSGAALAAGTDYPAADSGDPLVSLSCMVTRIGARGEPAGGWYAEQRVDVETALRAMTAAAAFAAFQEDDLGALTPGRFADFTVLSADPRTTAPERLKDLSITMTVVHGAPTYQSSTTASGS